MSSVEFVYKNATINICANVHVHTYPYVELQWMWLCVGDREMSEGGGEGGAGDGDHMIRRGGVYPQLQLEPHVL